jgi:hypothetical protein
VIAKNVPAKCGTRTFSTGIAYIHKHEHKRHAELVGVGVSFADRVQYASGEEKAAWTHTRGVTSVRTAPVEMEAVAALSKRCEDPVQHEILAYAKDERPTRVQVVADAERLLCALDMADHQYVLSVHTDTDDLHAHVIANRVGPDGLANARWREKIARERVCAQISAERGWAIVVGFHNRDIVREHLGLEQLPPQPHRRTHDVAFAHMHGRGEPPWQDVVRADVLEAVERATSWEDLRARLDAHGVILKHVERGGRFQGLAFTQGVGKDAPGCAASRISDVCKLSALEARFGPYRLPGQDLAYDAAQAREAALAELPALQAAGAVERAQGIADNARLRADYEGYRERFLAERSEPREAAWGEERALREQASERRREAKVIQETLVRTLLPQGARELGYAAVDALHAQAVQRDRRQARERWTKAKEQLAGERGERATPLPYRDFLAQRAAEDAGARRVLAYLDAGLRTEPRAYDAQALAALVADPRPLLDRLTAHDATFTAANVARLLASQTDDPTQRQALGAAILERSVTLEDGRGGQRFTTEAVLEVENTLIAAAKGMAAQRRRLGISALPGEHLDEQQRAAYAYATVDGSSLRLITGVPGAGKTTLVREIAATYEAYGYRVRGVAVANAAVEVLRREAGISARSVAKELWEWSAGRERLEMRDVLLVDEASTLGTVQGAALLSEARAAGAVVIMLGDDRQFQAVAHGDALAVVQRALGEASVDMAQTRRQAEAWQREATHAVRRGEVRAAIDAYREHGCVREFATQAQARAALVERWAQIELEGTPCGIEAFTNAERVALNELAREQWRGMGRLSGEDALLETMDGRTPYAIGERVLLRERVPEAGLYNGSAGTVRGIDGTTLSIERRDGAVVAVDTAKHPGVQHGYCSTEYREQGSTRYAELQLVTRHVHQRSLTVGMTRHTDAYGMFYSREEVGSYEELIALGLRSRSKELASDFAVVERGREPEERALEERAPQRSETIVGRFAEVEREKDEERAAWQARPAPERESVAEVALERNGYAAFRERIAQLERELAARAKELARERDALGIVHAPRELAQQQREALELLRGRTFQETAFTQAEQERLEQAQGQQRSWNPLTRMQGERTEERMLHEREQRYEAAWKQAQALFRERTAPEIEAKHAEKQRERVLWEERMAGNAREQGQVRHARSRLEDARRDLGILERAEERTPRLEPVEGGPERRAEQLARTLGEAREALALRLEREGQGWEYAVVRERIGELERELAERAGALARRERELGDVREPRSLDGQRHEAMRALEEQTRRETDFTPGERGRLEWARGERHHGNMLMSRVGEHMERGLLREREERFKEAWDEKHAEFRERVLPRIEAEYAEHRARWLAWKGQMEPLRAEQVEVRQAQWSLEKAGKDLSALERGRVELPEHDRAGDAVHQARALERSLGEAREQVRTVSAREARWELEPIARGEKEGYREQERAAARLFVERLEKLESSATLVVSKEWRAAFERPERLEAQTRAVEREWAQAREAAQERELQRSIERELGISMSRGRGR